MKASQVRAKTMGVISKRREMEKRSRDSIETEMSGVYGFIEKVALDGKFSCAFPANGFSSKAQDELERNGFKVKLTQGIGGAMVQVEWLDI